MVLLVEIFTSILMKKGFICDMDGVIYHGNQILPGVPEFIQLIKDQMRK